ncbi:MAG: hypothetical protein GEV07_24790 [Streptosporangiales bacterium]|nr:hypothetical protein [Streptosporangiales bacterium]
MTYRARMNGRSMTAGALISGSVAWPMTTSAIAAIFALSSSGSRSGRSPGGGDPACSSVGCGGAVEGRRRLAGLR